MDKFFLSRRFTKNNFNELTLDRFGKLLGPFQNFIDVRIVHYMNIRIIMEDGIFKFRKVNNHLKSLNTPVDTYVRSLMRTYLDGIVTWVGNIILTLKDKTLFFNNQETYDVDFENTEILRDVFYKMTPRDDRKKPIGIVSKDLSMNLMKNHQCFKNDNLYKYIFTKKDKYEKVKSKYEQDLNELKWNANFND